MISKLWKILLSVYIFLLPWQTRWIFAPRYVNGEFWEYGSSSWYGTEILLWAAIILFAFDRGRCINFSHLFGKIHYKTHKLNLYVALGFVVFLGSAVVFSLSPVISYDYVFRFLEGVCLLLMLAGSGRVKNWLYIFWSSAIVQALFGTYQFFYQSIGANKWLGLAAHNPADLGSFVVEFGDERWLRAYGSFGSPNILGGFLAAAFVLGVVMYLYSKPAEKILLTLGQSVILIGLVLSFSRGAWVAAVVGWVAVGIMVMINSRNREVKFFVRYHLLGIYVKQFILSALVVGVVVSMLSPLFAARLSGSGRLEKRSLTERVDQYKVAEKIIADNIFFGVGPGTYTLQLMKENPLRPAYENQPVHNSYLLVMAEWGVIGAAIWVLIFGYLARHILNNRPEYFPVVITILVAAVFDHFWVSLPAGVVVWWLVFALFLA